MTTYFICDKELRRHVDCAYSTCKLVFTQDWKEQVQAMEKGMEGASRNLLFGHPLGLAILQSNPDAERLGELAAKLHIPCRTFETDTPDKLNGWIADLLLDDAREARKDAGLARKDAAILRCDLEMQQQAFLELESAVNEFGIPLMRMALEWPLGMGTFRLSSISDGEAPLHQRIPASARGLACVEIHVESMEAPSEDSMVEVHIADLSGNPLAGSGPRQLSDFHRGWNRIPMLQPANCTNKDAMLVLTMQGAGSIDLSLAPVVPLGGFQLKRGGEAVADAPIALKVWRGFPGLKAGLPVSADRAVDSIRLSPGQVGRPRIYSCDDTTMGFEPVQYWLKEDGILVHPPGKGMTVAMVEGLDLQDYSAVTAIVNNNHREASLLSFAIGLVPSGQFFDISDILGTWLTLAPTAWGEVHAATDASHNGKYDLLMACMVASGNSNQKAWGLFRGFLLHSRKP